MTRIFLRACVATVRLWTHVYTCGLPPQIRDARREDIACDLWHGIREPGRGSEWCRGLHIMLRLVLGIPDDLGWRVEQPWNERSWIRLGLTAGITVVLVLAGSGLLEPVSPAPLPPPAPEGRAASDVTYPPPPPPPPAPASSNARSRPIPIQAVYGRATYAIATEGSAPARIKEVPAVYPPILMAAAVDGVVIVEGRITESGRVADLRAVQSQGFLTHSAINAVRQWEFEPSQRSGGRNVLTVTVRFAQPERSSPQTTTR